MAYHLFHDLFPAVAEQETRTMTILPGASISLSPGDYGFLEMFCDEPGCDCRRVFFSVVSSAHHELEAVIAWGWETPEFYAEWMNNGDPEIIADLKGPVLNLGSPATARAPALLELTRNVLLQDTNYIERIKRHYQMYRQQIDGAHPADQAMLALYKRSRRHRHTEHTGRHQRRR